MPGVQSNPTREIAGPLVAVPEPVENAEGAPLRPRQPTSLQGLLRFAMEATKAEDAPHESHLEPMDEERKKFLEDALKSMTIDVIELLQKQIAKLKSVDKLEPDQDPTEYLEAAETICDYIDHIDVANDFHKIGGFMVLRPCLNSQNPKIRAAGCELIALLTQNNPYCQRIILENNFLPELLEMLDKDSDIQVLLKILYALGGIVRENIEGFNQLISYNGLVILLKILNTKHEKLVVKICFLLSSLCKSQPDMKSRLVFLNYIPTLVQIIDGERNMGHEHALSLLVTLTEDNPAAVNELKDPKYNFRDILLKHKSIVQNNADLTEEEQYCRILMHLVR